MTDQKRLNREVEKTWEALKRERRARSSIKTPADLAAAGERVAALGTALVEASRQSTDGPKASKTKKRSTKSEGEGSSA